MRVGLLMIGILFAFVAAGTSDSVGHGNNNSLWLTLLFALLCVFFIGLSIFGGGEAQTRRSIWRR